MAIVRRISVEDGRGGKVAVIGRHFRNKLRILSIRLFLLWLPFSLGCLIAIPLSLKAILHLDGNAYAKNLLLAMDKLAAASLQFSGLHTVSAECGKLLHTVKDALTPQCIFCRLLCRFIHRMDAGHCERNARDDGLIQ
jgi:hypothetical protein